VYSTLHTKNAVNTIARLISLKLDRSKIASALDTIVSMKLLKKLCPHCSKKVNEYDRKILEEKIFKSYNQ